MFDVSCRLDDGSWVDVEVQVSPQNWFADRCLYYSTYCIQSQVHSGQDEYKPVYIVSIDAFTMRHGPEWNGSILSSYSIREDTTHEMLTDSLHFVFVELDRFNKKWEDIDNDKERFYFCIRHLHELDSLPDGFARGRAEGRAEGHAEGHAEGLEHGRRETAIRMKAAGLTPEIISQCTGLSLEQVAML